jgi:hypothetical protein
LLLASEASLRFAAQHDGATVLLSTQLLSIRKRSRNLDGGAADDSQYTGLFRRFQAAFALSRAGKLGLRVRPARFAQ